MSQEHMTQNFSQGGFTQDSFTIIIMLTALVLFLCKIISKRIKGKFSANESNGSLTGGHEPRIQPGHVPRNVSKSRSHGIFTRYSGYFTA